MIPGESTRSQLLWAPVRVAPTVFTAFYLAVLHGPASPTTRDWLFGLAAAALSGLGAWWPLSVSVAQSVLLTLALRGGLVQVAMPVLFTLAIVALGELWVRRSGWQSWTGAVVLAAAQLVLYLPHYDLVLSTSSIVLLVAPPVLLGAYIRSVLRVAILAGQQRDSAVREARAAERAAIARELHDLVAHHMASIAIQVGAARYALAGANEPVDQALVQAHDTARAALNDLTRLMTTLRDPDAVATAPGTAMVEPAGLRAALSAVVDRARNAGCTVDAEVDEAVVELDAMRRLAMLRVVQEAMTNVLKHAGPHAAVSLSVAVGEEDVRVAVRDDGGGRAGPHPRSRAGYGLVGMRERVELLGGTVRAGRIRPGWSVVAQIPRRSS